MAWSSLPTKRRRIGVLDASHGWPFQPLTTVSTMFLKNLPTPPVIAPKTWSSEPG
jgi:hypothetical protein